MSSRTSSSAATTPAACGQAGRPRLLGPAAAEPGPARQRADWGHLRQRERRPRCDLRHHRRRATAAAGQGVHGSIVATATLPTGRFSRVSVGQTHTCAIRVEGGAVCWGSNGDGQAPPAPSPSAGGPYNVAEGSAIALAGSAAPVGRPLSYAWDLDGDGGFETTGQTPAYTGRDGPSSPAAPLRVCTDQAICGVATASVGVANVARTAAFPPPAEVAIGRPIPLALTGAADPAPADAAAGFTYAFDCGNGNQPEGPASVLNCPARPGRRPAHRPGAHPR